MSGEKEATGEDRAVRIGRVLDSFLSRREAGESVSEAELYTRHPDIALELRMHLDLLGDLPPTADKIDTLIAKGLLARSEDPKYPAQLGAYKILDYIGRGGMGIVLKAYEESLNRTVALKILRPELADDRVALERFTREAKAAAALKHPNIVTVHAIGHERGVPFIAMEYVEGPSLAEVIRSVGSPCPTDAADCVGSPRPTDLEDELDAGRAADFSPRGVDLPETNDTARAEARGSSLLLSSSHSSSGSRFPLTTDTIRHIFRQLLEALAAAHDAGLIHRDVKSSNILLTSSSSVPQQPGAAVPHVSQQPGVTVPHDPEPRALKPEPSNRTLNPEPSIKLADFGLARMLSSQTRMTANNSILGTPEYMSPEQACGDADIDHRTDLYSAGVVLYEMLTGRTPFRADTPSAVIHQILHTDPPAPRTFNQNVDPVLVSLALRLIAKRPEDRFGSAHEVLNALEAERRVSLLEQRRRLRRSVTISLVVVALLLTGTWILSRFDFRSNNDISPPRTARTIADVWVERRNGMPTTRIMAVYEDAVGEEVFHTFPREVRAVNAVTLVDRDGRGNQAVIAGLGRPLNGANVIALDSRGEELWVLDLSNHPQVKEWPGYTTPDYWPSGVLAGAQLDNALGEELIAVTHDNHEYPTRLSIIDPRLPKTLSNFWHTGQISSIQVVPDFFDGQRPAILAWGYNNKLRRIPLGSSDDLEEAAEWDVVMAVMILDPAQLVKQPDGLGPHGLDSHHALVGAIVPAPVHAYAFVGVADGPATGALAPARGKEYEPHLHFGDRAQVATRTRGHWRLVHRFHHATC